MFGLKKKEDVFYTLFIEYARKIEIVGETFLDLLKHYENVEEKVEKIKLYETECDQYAHDILNKLNVAFITPFDREDIYSVTKQMDDIVDCIEEASNRFVVFDVNEIRPEAIAIADLILQSTKELVVLFEHLPDLKKNNLVKTQIIEVNRLENEGDVIYREALMKLFREDINPIELIKWKHILEQIEESLDSCENVANIIEGVAMKYA
ncbi:MAG: DUF47 domain-containing protein [Eubacteriales bacterium]